MEGSTPVSDGHNISFPVSASKTDKFFTETYPSRHNVSHGALAGSHHANQVQVGAVQSRTQQSGWVNLEAFMGAATASNQCWILERIFDALIECFRRIFPLKATHVQNRAHKTQRIGGRGNITTTSWSAARSATIVEATDSKSVGTRPWVPEKDR